MTSPGGASRDTCLEFGSILPTPPPKMVGTSLPITSPLPSAHLADAGRRLQAPLVPGDGWVSFPHLHSDGVSSHFLRWVGVARWGVMRVLRPMTLEPACLGSNPSRCLEPATFWSFPL